MNITTIEIQSPTQVLLEVYPQVVIGTGGGSGTVTSITAGTGLTGGTITTSGTIAVDFGTSSTQVPAGNHTHDYTTLTNLPTLGTISSQNASSVAITGGSITGVTAENISVTTGTYVSQINEAVLVKVRKGSSGTITKGQVVRVVGSTGTHLTVELAQANTEANSATTLGVAATDIVSGADGFAMQLGRLNGLSVLPTATFTDGDSVYLSETTAGGLRVGIPTQPNHGVFIGFCVDASNGSSGILDVRVDNYQELEELSDVYITGEATNDFLVYDTNRWVNKTAANSRTALGLGTVATESTVPISKGGTGQTSKTPAFDALAPTTTAGDIIYYNGTDNIRLPIGTAGKVLTVNSGATAPEWATAASGGVSSLNTFTGTVTVSAGNDVTVTNSSNDIKVAYRRNPNKTINLIWDGGTTPVPFNASNTNGTAVYTSGVGADANHFNSVSLGTGTSATGRSSFATAVGDVIIGTTGALEIRAIVLMNNLSTTAETFGIGIGLNDALSSAPGTDHAQFYYSHGTNGGKFQLQCGNNLGSETADSGITLAANTWYNLFIEIPAGGTQAKFYIDGTLVGTLNGYPPRTTIGLYAHSTILKSNGTTARNLFVDYMELYKEVTR